MADSDTPRLARDDISRMTQSAFIEGPLRGAASTRFWILLTLSAVIATAGLVADSVATVIGAMIVAPLMTPILGVALGLVLSSRRHMLASVGYTVSGALVVIAIAALISVVFSPPDAYASNEQVMSRVSPSLVDLLAALATGLVGAFALVRSDIHDIVPGVAIAISLVPPLAVTGMLLQTGQISAALQSLLLFGTNVAAIIATCTVILLAYRVRAAARASGMQTGRLTRRSLIIVIGTVILISFPLAAGTLAIALDQRLKAALTPIADEWAGALGWEVTAVYVRSSHATVTVVGAPPMPDPADLRVRLNQEGYSDAPLTVVRLAGSTQWCAPHEVTCSAIAQ